jgi:hypothetical protein
MPKKLYVMIRIQVGADTLSWYSILFELFDRAEDRRGFRSMIFEEGSFFGGSYFEGSFFEVSFFMGTSASPLHDRG